MSDDTSTDVTGTGTAGTARPAGTPMPDGGAPAAIGPDRDGFLVYGEGSPAAVARALSRDDYSFVTIPEHAVWMKVFAGDVLGIGDPELALASLYLLMPTVKKPAAVARRLAASSLLR